MTSISVREFKLMNNGKNPQQNKRLMERAIASAADELNLSFMLPGYVSAIGEKTRSVPADPGTIEEYLKKTITTDHLMITSALNFIWHYIRF